MTLGLEARVREFLERTGCLEQLTRWRLRAPLGKCWRALREPSTLWHYVDVRRDHQAFAAAYRAVVGGGGHLADGSKRVMVVSLSNWICQVKIESLLTKALQVRGYTPVIVTHRDAGSARRYYEIFGFGRYYMFDEAIERVPADAVAHDADALMAQATSIQAIKHWQYRGVNVGRQALATITRSQHASCDIRAGDWAVRLQAALLQAMRSVLAAERLVDEVAPDIALFLEKDYLGIGSIYDVCINRCVNTLQWCLSHRDDSYTLKRFPKETRNLLPKSVSSDAWREIVSMPWT